ncbi:MAG: helix-turn-helix transcriptional regulator [Kordiimonadaceae bacterium]|jgi:DNA-binding transcriptional ArsR family regulator|nr:helix-turn-helix transcriptional regulator [Kordiimonadaceae bacterium]MBT6033593.1 helix-turn-helix transcriptional regulator [Kordiimonadaceae bacterium]
MVSEQLDMTFAALSDATRRGILERLSAGEATVGEIAAPYEMSMAAVSKHLKVLEKAGLITRSKKAQWRHCRLEAAPLADAMKWVEKYKGFWDDGLNRLDHFLKKQMTD